MDQGPVSWEAGRFGRAQGLGSHMSQGRGTGGVTRLGEHKETHKGCLRVPESWD